MIKVENRNFIIPTDERVIGVVGENAATTVQFEIDRFINDIDFARLACFLDVYPIDKSKKAYNNVISTEIQDEKIIISWVVLSHDLINSGKLWFNLRFVEIKEDIVDSQDYAVYITNKDYFVIWEDARQHNNEILTPNDLQNQILAQTTEQANIAIRQAKISTDALIQMEYERELAQQAVDEANAQVDVAKLAADSAENSAIKSIEASVKAEQYKNEAMNQVGLASNQALEATNQAKLSKSWAVGGTGVRADEDTNNSKYWCSKAKAIVGGDFVNHTEFEERLKLYELKDSAIDCGLFTESFTTSIATHNISNNTHKNMRADGNTTSFTDTSTTLEEHQQNELAHQNLHIDGNMN